MPLQADNKAARRRWLSPAPNKAKEAPCAYWKWVIHMQGKSVLNDASP